MRGKRTEGWKRKRRRLAAGALAAALVLPAAVPWGGAASASDGQDYSGNGSATAVQVSILSGLSAGSAAGSGSSVGHALIGLGGATGLLGGLTNTLGKVVGGVVGGVTGLVGGLLGGSSGGSGNGGGTASGTTDTSSGSPATGQTGSAGGAGGGPDSLLGGLTGPVTGLTGTIGGLTGTVGGLSGAVGNTVGGLSGAVGNTVGGLVGGLTGTLGGLTGGLTGSNSGGSAAGDVPAGTSVQIGVSQASLDSAAAKPSQADAYPLGVQAPGAGMVKPLGAHAEAPPDSEDGGPIPDVNAGGVQAKLLNARAKAVWEGGYPASESNTSTANVGALGLLNLGAVETSTSVTTDPSGALTTTSHMHVADLSLAGVVKIAALDATVTATANGQSGGAKVTSDFPAVKLSILGIPYEIQSGQVLNIPGVAKVTLGEVGKQEDPAGLTASGSGSGLTIELLGALFNGITVQIGAVHADAKVPEGGIPFQAPYTLAKTAVRDTVEPGGEIEYHLVYNITRDIPGVQIKDPLPDHTSFVSADSGGTYDPSQNAVIWNLGDQKKDDGGVLTFRVKVDPATPEGTVIANTATISAPGAEPVSSQTVDVTVGAKVHIPFLIGYPDGTFRPDRSVTRAELATIVAHIMKLQDYTNQPISFRDVPSNYWARPFIAAVTAKHLFPTFNDQTFRPDQPATRAEVAAVMVRMQQTDPVEFAKLPAGAKATFTDVPAGYWAYNDIETAVRLGFLSGYPDGHFGPDDPVTRAQVVSLLGRALGRGPLVDGKIPVVQHYPDVAPGSWYFGWVEEATRYGHKGVYVEGHGEELQSYVPDVNVW
ncbi:choice-of-anchor P family protein [Kyrpidia sp.]|uniref:choice-of-anchor P family protein n=1 Tax=Kyrpidia sp. TaxID=2073077 RepID=UPI0025829D0D|nr:choice-of-anchor P family protein [Kyrpidia sp.]MCL6576689.1 S-layer homology domain-containing protein [Kyrpidia sp.]